MYYVRARVRPPADDIPARRVFGPRDKNADEWCPACNEMFAAGDYTVLVVLGPGDDEEAREKARAGRWYNAVAVQVHADCAEPPTIGALP